MAKNKKLLNVKNFIEKIKPHQDSIFLVVVIVMVGLVGFGLGRLSAKYQTTELNIQSTLVNTADLSKIVTTSPSKNISVKKPSTVSINPQQAPSGEVVASNAISTDKKIVGNKQSKIYHFENCAGALKMKEENKIFFASMLEAKNAGYKPAGNCPGLE